MNKIKIIVDSSVAIKWINSQDEDFLKQADKILKDLQDKKIEIIMPELAKYEIGNALLNKGMSLIETQTVLEKFYEIPIIFIVEDNNLAKKTIDIAKTSNITYYDAAFLALTQKIGGVLITDNPKHQKKKIKNLKIKILKDYT